MTAIKKDFIVKNGLQVSEDAIVTGNVTASSFIGDGSQLTGVSSFSGNYNDLTNKPTLFSGSYNDLTDKPVIPTIPTNISAFTNDTGYLVATDLTWTNIGGKPTFATVATTGSYNDLTNKPTIPSLTGYATETYVNTQVANLVDSAPTTLDTLNELAAALADDPNFATTITNQLSLKANISSLATVATTGSYNDLIDKPSLSTLTNVDQLNFNTTYVPTSTTEGQLNWNALEGTLDITLLNGVTLQTGQENHFYAKAVGAIANGDLVMFAGAQGDHLLVTKADLNAPGFMDTWIVGVATQAFTNNQYGYITTYGKVRGLSTAAWAEGSILYANKDVLGGLTDVKPTAPNHIIEIAAVVRSHATQGTLLVRPTFGKHLADLHDVLISTPEINNDVLKYDTTTGVWKNAQLFNQSLNTNDNPSFSGISTNYLTLNGDSGFWGKIVTSQGSGGAVWDSLKTVGGTSLIGSGDISLFSGSYNDLTNKPAITPTAVSDQNNTSTGYFDVPAGTTAQRPASPNVGYIRFNTDLGFLEQYINSGWQGIAPPPAVLSVSPTTYNGEQGTSFTLNGTNFDTTATVKFITAQGIEYTAASVSRISSSQLIITTPQDFTVANEPLKVRVINGSGLSSTLDNAIDCGGVPYWNTASGNLGSALEQVSTSFSVSAGDPDSGATITYALESGSLPSGLSLNSTNGVISGNTTNISADTTYNFDLAANDNAGNKTVRSFNFIVYADLYDFAAVTLSEGTSYGRFGTDPTTWISRVAQSWASNTSYFSPVDGIIYWTVPRTGTYRILAAGAGGASNNGGSQAPSKGAQVRGNIQLTRGAQLKILVGKRGDPVDNGGSYYSLGAGGGGTFISYTDNTPLLVAGGGGGLMNATSLADQYFFGQTRRVPLVSWTSPPSQTLTAGQGGYGWDAGGGGGFSGDGFMASGATGTMTTNTSGYSTPYGCQGRAFTNTGIGGTNSSTAYGSDAEGGFGGGGGGHTGANAAGGGGGYTGGPGGYSGWGTTQGHGGGSFIHTNMTGVATSDGQYDGSNTFNGSITNIGYNTVNYAGYVSIERIA